ncbi:MAG: GAF domain-containing protein [Chloroflexi bacterium]|nr:GAF domain-containing protein [Chloroflexota bacterium]MBP7042618.1 GAF domain-containing protein [Chloroflexota bacterium]
MSQSQPLNNHLPYPFPEIYKPVAKPEDFSPFRLLFSLTMAVFTVELAIMLVIEHIYNPGDNFSGKVIEALLDASILAIFVFPTLYYLSFRPLVTSLMQYQVTDKALNRSYTFLGKVFASLNDGVLVVRVPDYTVLTSNVTAGRLFGESDAALIGQKLAQLFFEDTAVYETFIAEVNQNLKIGDLFHTEITITPQQKKKFSAEITVTEIRNEDEAYQVFTIRDITEKKRSEEKINLQTTALQAAVNGVLITDTNGITEWANPALSQMSGYTFEELIGQSGGLFDADLYDPERYQEMWRKLSAGQPWEGEIVNQRKDHSRYTELQTIAPVRNPQNVVTHYVAIKQDISQRKAVEAQLEKQNQELLILGKLGQTVVSSLELNVVFNQVIQQLMPLFQAECISIILREEGRLVYVATGGLHANETLGQSITLDFGVPGLVLASKEAICIIDNEEILADACGCDPQSTIAVPLRLGDEIFGLIQASHRRPHAFNKESLHMLQSAANWAAIAISHARQLQEIRMRLRETATLSAINQSLNETLDLENALQLIADSTPKLINNVDRVVIHLTDENEQVLYPVIWSGQPHMDTPSLYLNSGEGIAGRVMKTGKLINVPNIANSGQFRAFPTVPAIKSLMVGPLQSGRFQLGTISVHNQTMENAFSEMDERLLMRLAHSAAVAINTSRLYQAERQQRRFAEDLVQAAAALSGSLRVNEVLENILSQTIRVVRCHRAGIFLLRHNRVYLSQFSHAQEGNLPLPEALQKLLDGEDVRDFPPLRLIIETGKPIVVTESEDEYAFLSDSGLAEYSVFAAAPLRVGQDVIGFLNIYGDRPAAFDKDTIHRLEALAAHATLAVQNARLYNELEAALEKEQVTRLQLVQAQKLSAMGRLVASVAHELNNPLQTIKNCLFLTQQDIGPEAITQTYLEMAISETTRLKNLVLQLRDVYRPSGSEEMQPVLVTAVISQVSFILKQHFKENSITLQFTPPENEYTVMGDANQLAQVLLNICLNAVEAIQPDSGMIRIQMLNDKEDRFIGIQIQDSGPGIPTDIIDNLFEPFFTTKTAGTGLGLAICYDIVQNHGGYITVENSQTEGAIFDVWLPLL